MTDIVELSPTWFAELVGPAVTRAFVAGLHAGGTGSRDLIEAYGGQEAIGYLVHLRNPLAAGRPVSPDGLAAIFRYHGPQHRYETVQRSVDHGLLERAQDGTITASARGRTFLQDLFALHGRVLAERWGDTSDEVRMRQNSDRVRQLNALLDRVFPEAAATGGAAWAAQAPPHHPDGTPAPVLLLNRLTMLRYHRADAHAAAWQAAGLTADDMVAMPWGTEWSRQRVAVEHDTNERAGVPYAGLTAEERLRLLADLAALP